MKAQRKFRILMVNDHLHFGGGGDAVFRVEREAYEDRGFEVYTFSHGADGGSSPSERDFVAEGGGTKISAKVGKFLYCPKVSAKFREALSIVKPDVVSVHLVSRYPLAIYKWLRDYPVIQTLHGPNLFCATSWGCLPDGSDCEMGIGIKCYSRNCVSLPEALLYSSLDKRLQRDVKAAVNLYLCPSHHIMASAESLGYSPAQYVPLGIDERFLNVPASKHDGELVVLSVGALSKQKGLNYLIGAFQSVIEKFPNAKLQIAGRGREETALRNQAEEAGVAHAVEFLGFVERESIVDVYQKASVFVMPSVWKEQFGLVGPEALACGIPCVGSQMGGIPEWLHDGKWGYVVPPRDVAALADSISKILGDKSLRLLMGQEGRAWALSEYSPLGYCEKRLETAILLSSAKGGDQ